MRDIADYTKNYIEQGFEDYQVIYRRKKVMEILKQYKPNRILEIGCGMEPLFKYADWEFYLWTIVEPSDVFYEKAKKAAIDARKKSIRVCHEFFPSHSIDKMQFDFVVCSALLHEVEDSGQFLEEIASVCSKDTIVHINVPNANSFHRILAKNMGLLSDVHEFSLRNRQLQQHRVFDMESLEKEVKQAGFSICNRGSYFLKPFTHTQMYKMIEADIIGEDVLDGLYAISEIFKEYGSEIYINAKLAE